jgi:hypothetical protein
MSTPTFKPIILVRAAQPGDAELPDYVASRLCHILFGADKAHGPHKKEGSPQGYDLGSGNDYWLHEQTPVWLSLEKYRGGTRTNLANAENGRIPFQAYTLDARYANLEKLWSVARTIILVEDHPGIRLGNDPDVST